MKMGRELQAVNHNNRLMEWSKLVEGCRNSGLTVAEWCKEHRIATSTYFVWQRKVFKAVASGQEVCFSEVPLVQPAQPTDTAVELLCSIEMYVWRSMPVQMQQPSEQSFRKDFNCSCPVYIACGYTDLRRRISGLAGMVQTQFQMDPFQTALFLFCGRSRDRIKALYWEGNGFLLLYKRLETGSFQWPQTKDEVRTLTPQQYR